MRFSRSSEGGLWSNEEAMKTPATPPAASSDARTDPRAATRAEARGEGRPAAAAGASPAWAQRVSPAWLLAALVPLSVLVGAALGEAVVWLLAGGWRAGSAAAAMPGAMPAGLHGLGALAGACVAALVVPLVAVLTWRVLPRKVVASAAAPAVDGGATRDQLTGAFTQRHFVAAADREWARIRRHGEDAALLMIDADQFRELNDKQGQACGDAVLVEATRQVSATLRQYDLLARFGGGVLVVYLPHTDPIGALDVAERIRERVAGFKLNWNGQPVGVTVSIGVASIGENHAALDAVIADAGTALREAKAAGRNCVRAAPVQPRRNTVAGSSLGGHRAAGKA